ncbi:MAG: ABC transporter ATP-binding protein [Rhodospirillaceae bacterium]|nr:ABC transporter ATP-binding protein [Rhodospirillaceae bacterium]
MKNYPLQSAVTIIFFMISSILDSTSIILIVPIISIMSASTGNSSGFEAYVQDILSFLGFTDELGPLLVLMVGVVSFSALVKILGGIQIALITNRIANNLRLALVNAILAAKWGYSSQLSPGGVNAALGTEVEAASSIYTSVGKGIAAGWQTAIGLSVSIAISPSMTAGGFAFGIVTVVVFSTFVSRTRASAIIRRNSMETLSTRIVEIMSSLKGIKAMGHETQVLPLVAVSIGSVRKARNRLAFYERAIQVLPEPIAAAAIAIGIFVYINMMSGGLETAAALALLFSRSATSIRSMQKQYQAIVGQEPSYQFVNGLIVGSENAAEIVTGTKEPQFRSNITLRDLTVVYEGQSNAALTGVSLELPRSGLVAITGPSGAGKSTLINAIAGLETATSGSVEIDGVPLPDFDIAKWRKMIGYVPQEIFLFPESIRENVTTSDPDITVEKTIEALRHADAWNFVQGLDDGIDTRIGQAGSKLSGGERQRIAVARALVHQPQLLIMDEPTAALDNESEQRICRALKHLSTHVLILIISHRPAIVNAADIVIELNDGKLTSVHKAKQGPVQNFHVAVSEHQS